MTTVLEMSTDADIVRTQLNDAWNPVLNRHSWAQVSATNLAIAGGETIVVIAHGSPAEIGNQALGTVDVNAETFLVLIQGNMAVGTVPAAIYISACGQGIAQFAAAVRIAAESNHVWDATRIFGHSDPVAGPVPAPTNLSWFQIFGARPRTNDMRVLHQTVNVKQRH
jgi:hypothetical protein